MCVTLYEVIIKSSYKHKVNIFMYVRNYKFNYFFFLTSQPASESLKGSVHLVQDLPEPVCVFIFVARAFVKFHKICFFSLYVI